MNPKEKVEAALEKIKDAPSWLLKERIEWLKTLDLLLRYYKERILRVVSEEKECSDFRVLINEYSPVRLLVRYYIKNAQSVLGPENRSKPFSFLWGTKKISVHKEPFEIVGVISPLNYPFSLPLGPVISALLAGNRVILKPADAPKTNILIYELITKSLATANQLSRFAMLPADIECGKELVACRDVQKIHFTGSYKTGMKVHLANNAVRFVPATLELGGSNPAIVLEDADLEKTASVIVWARFSGMSCNNIKRVFAVGDIFEELYKKIKSKILVMSPEEFNQKYLDEDKNSYENFLHEFFKSELIDSENYCIRCGNEFLKPTLLKIKNPYNNLSVLKEEVFVPILPIIRVESAEEAVNLSNNSPYGLGASVFTSSKRRFREIAHSLECAVVLMNDAMTEFAIPQVPFGGWKSSGYGYTHAPEGLLEFIRLKTIIEEKRLRTIIKEKIEEKIGVPQIQLFPWTKRKISLLKRWGNKIINLS